MTQEIIEKPMSAECTMKQYEAIPDSDFVENREYQLTDYPDNGANAEQMAYALTCKRLFPAGTVVTFSGTTDNTYTNGHLYQIQVDTSGTKSWKDITPVSEQSIPILTGTQEKPINLATDLEVGKWYILRGNIYSLNKSRVFEKDILIYKIKTDKCSTLFVNHSGALGTDDNMFTRDNSVLSLNLDETGKVTSVGHRFIPYINGYNLQDAPTLTIYTPLSTPNTEPSVAVATYSQRTPQWKEIKYLATKQQTYYLAELPTITTSPYAEHDQVVVNNQDVYALEKVDSTLTWVKKYSVGGENESIITLIGTQEKPINLATDLEDGKWYLLTGYVHSFSSQTLHLTDSTESKEAFVLTQKDNYSRQCIFKGFEMEGTANGYVNCQCDSIVDIDTQTGNINSYNVTCGISRFNGSMKNKAVTFYAPTSAGTNGQVLQSNGSGEPTWIDNKMPTIKHSEIKNDDTETTKEDTWETTDIDTTLSVRHQNGTSQSGLNVSKDFAEITCVDTGEETSSVASVKVIDDNITLGAQDSNNNQQSIVITPTSAALNGKEIAQQYLELEGTEGTLTDEQYKLVQDYDTLIIKRTGVTFRQSSYPQNGSGDYVFVSPFYAKPNGTEEFDAYIITIKTDKTWNFVLRNFLVVGEQTYAPFVELTPDSATNGTLSDEDFENLTSHDDVYIKLNKEYYRLSDNEHTQGIRSYTHNGWNGDAPQDKSINITISTKAWTLAIGKTRYYRHYIQLNVDSDKAIYYDFSSTQSEAYTADTLPSMPDDIITAFQIVVNHYYSSISGLVYRDSVGTLKVVAHGMYTDNGTSMTYLELTGKEATFVKDVVKNM